MPGGVSAEPAWKDLVGASPASPAAFIEKLMAKDKGWLAAYFDVLSRISGTQQAYFTDPHRLRLFYSALRASDAQLRQQGEFSGRRLTCCFSSPACRWDENGAAARSRKSRSVERDPSPGTRLSFGARVGSKGLSRLTNADELVRTMFAVSRAQTDSGPLQIYMAISELDSRRIPGHRLAPATVRLMALKFEEFSDQYRIFSEFPELSDESIDAVSECGPRAEQGAQCCAWKRIRHLSGECRNVADPGSSGADFELAFERIVAAVD